MKVGVNSWSFSLLEFPLVAHVPKPGRASRKLPVVARFGVSARLWRAGIAHGGKRKQGSRQAPCTFFVSKGVFMRVVYVVSLFPCWSETFIVREINELIATGIDVKIVSLKHASEEMVQTDAQALLDRVIYPQSAASGAFAALGEILTRPLLSLRELTRLSIGLWREPNKLAKSVVTWWRSLGLAPVVRRLAAQRLHAHWATYPTTAAQILGPRVGLPFSFTCHAHDIFVERHFVKSKLEQAQFAVTISRFNVDYLKERLGQIAEEKLRVIHCGVVPSAIAYVKPDDLTRRKGLLVSVGRLDGIKGFEALIDACQLLTDRGVSYECVIVGEGPLRASLQAQISAAGLDGVVTMPGARPGEAVRALLAQAQVFVLPSRVTPAGDRDGIPVALMEAMAAGAPVVSTRVSGIPELIESGKHGLLVEADDASALSAAIESQLTQPKPAAQMAQAARARIEQAFNVTTETARLRAAFLAPDGHPSKVASAVTDEGCS